MSEGDSKIVKAADYEAAVVDLDGVVVRTARVHARAWKQMFDNYNARRQQNRQSVYEPFDVDTDYPQYVDGKPRYHGVRDFLASRGIELPWGDPTDPPDRETVCGLGNWKNTMFQRLLREVGAEKYDHAIEWIKNWKALGKKAAVVSSSRNCKLVLDTAGLQDLFDARVDGLTAAELNLNGKPDPDIFLEGAKRVGTTPDRAVMFEDAIVGVQAGRAGGFGLVVGIDRRNAPQPLYDNGADIVISDLAQLRIDGDAGTAPRDARDLPHALEPAQLDHLRRQLEGKEPVLFFDYDGTLTKIVPRPEDAILSEGMRESLSKLATLCTVAVVSGRDRADVKNLVGMDELIYAGSHGFDITGPDGLRMQNEGGRNALPDLDEAQRRLHQQIDPIPGAQVERKRFAIAVHYRNVADEDVEKVERIAREVLDRYDTLKEGGGKKIVELKPNIDWDKGKALLWLLDHLKLNRPDVLPFYLGDDLTDEDALRVLAGRGVGVLVGEHGEKTWADYRLDSVDEVDDYLRELIEILEQRGGTA